MDRPHVTFFVHMRAYKDTVPASHFETWLVSVLFFVSHLYIGVVSLPSPSSSSFDRLINLRSNWTVLMIEVIQLLDSSHLITSIHFLLTTISCLFAFAIFFHHTFFSSFLCLYSMVARLIPCLSHFLLSLSHYSHSFDSFIHSFVYCASHHITHVCTQWLIHITWHWTKYSPSHLHNHDLYSNLIGRTNGKILQSTCSVTGLLSCQLISFECQNLYCTLISNIKKYRNISIALSFFCLLGVSLVTYKERNKRKGRKRQTSCNAVVAIAIGGIDASIEVCVCVSIDVCLYIHTHLNMISWHLPQSVQY